MQPRALIQHLTEGNGRLLFPVCVVVALRVAYATVLYDTLRLGGAFSTPFVGFWKTTMPFDWLYLFSAWDTAYYQLIALSWYPPFQAPVWAFFPLYPAATRLLILAQVNNWLAAFLISTACGLLSIPVFLKMAEKYLSPRQAMTSTLLYFLLPPVFVFSGVSYSEPIFLLFSLLSWHFHRERKELKASVSAALCSLARPYGILIGVPLAYEYLKHKQPGRLVYLLIPMFTLGAWSIYGTLRTHVPLPMFTAGWYWHTPTASRILENLMQLAQGDLTAIGPLLPYAPLALTIIASLALTVFLGYLAFRIDKSLALYILVTVCIIAAVTRGNPAATRSFPRFLGFLFPIGLPLHTSRRWLLVLSVIALLVLDYISWLAFLTDGFY